MSKKFFILPALAASLALSPSVHALDLGLEAALRLEASDNVDQLSEGEEEVGQIGFASFEVFGEQRGRFLQGGFSGELQTRRELSDEDDNPSTLNNFFGGLNLQLSPAFSWYAGNVLGSVRVGDGILPTDEDEVTQRRNVFVTGPTLNFEIDAFRRFNAEILYFNQNQSDRDLAQLVTAQFDFSQDTDGGNTFGFAFSDIYTDEPDSSEDGEVFASDSNRISGALFWERDRGRVLWYAEVGATQFDVDDESIAGANLAFRVARQLSAVSTLEFGIGTDLSDQNISAIDSLLDDGSGVETEAPGIFQSTVASLIYNNNGARNSYQLGVSAEDSQFQTLQTVVSDIDPTLEDSVVLALFGSVSRFITPRISADAGFRYENERFDNLDDESDSVAASVRVDFALTESFTLGVGARTSFATGINTREFVGGNAEGEFDITENRAVFELRWAPPSRATREPVVQLKQLLR